MSFITDKQTLDDLNIRGRYKADSIIGLFNKVATPGGLRLLEHLFATPLTEAKQIGLRTQTLQYFGWLDLSFPFDADLVEKVEGYLSTPGPKGWLPATTGALRKRILAATVRDEGWPLLESGVNATRQLLRGLTAFVALLGTGGPYKSSIDELTDILSSKEVRSAVVDEGCGPVRCDYLLRSVLYDRLLRVLEILYEMDVYIAVSRVAVTREWTYASVLSSPRGHYRAKGLCHPVVSEAVGNDLYFDRRSNLVFLTGANMAGKSTLMKAFGISVYLAHMGFPVAAKELELSVMDGLYSSINVPDNISLGYSHFYAEVLRVKTVAREVAGGKNLVVIFDELFKGTNVKDAFDATLAVTEAFAAYSGCFYLVSTHIVEVGEALQRSAIRCCFLPTVMEGNIPRYTYRLEEGISADRHGMMIIRNEGILELLK